MSDAESRAIVRVGPSRVLPGEKRELFSYQHEAMQQLLAWYSGPATTGVLVLPTGGGKTRVAAELVTRTVAQTRGGASCLWLAHRTELVEQAVEAITSLSHRAAFDFNIGRYEAGEKVGIPVKVVVASIPSLVWRAGRGPLDRIDALWKRQGGFDLVVVDEAHHASAKTWSRLLRRIKGMQPAPHIVGLTATPTRQHQRERSELLQLLERVIFEVQPVTLIHSRHLARPSIHLVDTQLTFEISRGEAEDADTFGDLPESLVKRIATDEARNELAVRTFLENRTRWGRTLLFTGRVEQSRYLAERLRQVGVRAAAVDGSTAASERARILADFRAGALDCLCNVMVFTEGTDAPGTQTVFLVRPTRSPVLFQQMVGRGMRGPHVGGVEQCNVVAFVDHLRGLAERQVAHDYTWEWEQWERMGFADIASPRWLGSEPVRCSAAVVPESPSQQGLVSDAVRQHVREHLMEETLDLDALRSTLRGWWQIPREVGDGPRVWALPYFDGDVTLRPWVAELDAAIHAGAARASRDALAERFLLSHPVPPRLPTLSALTAAAFATRALSVPELRATNWVSIETATEADLAVFTGAMRAWRSDDAYRALALERIWARAGIVLARRWFKARQAGLFDENIISELARHEEQARAALGVHAGRELALHLLVLLAQEERKSQARAALKATVRRALGRGSPIRTRTTPTLQERLMRRDLFLVAGAFKGEAVPLVSLPRGVMLGRVVELQLNLHGAGYVAVLGSPDGTHGVQFHTPAGLAEELCVGHYLVAEVASEMIGGIPQGVISKWAASFAPVRSADDNLDCSACGERVLYMASDAVRWVCSRCGARTTHDVGVADTDQTSDPRRS